MMYINFLTPLLPQCTIKAILSAIQEKPVRKMQNYQLRHRVHDRQLPVHLGHLIDKNFTTRSLNKNMYWLLLLL